MTKLLFAGAVFACVLEADSAVAQMTGLSADERTLVEFVDRHNTEALTLLERVVNINSGTQNLAGVREVGKIFRQELDALGFKTSWVDGAPFKRAGHLTAELHGPGPKILLIGHLDTVFEADSPFQKFEKIDPTHARRPGIIDMKGGNVILVQALKALASIGALKRMNVTVVITGDEEDAGEPLDEARKALVDAAKGAEYAIGFEDGPGDPRTAVIARRGTSAWTLKVKAQPAHSSQIFRKDIGSGAIFEAARILNSFREKLAGEPHLTFNPGAIVGGTAADFDNVQARGSAFGKTNVIAEHAIVSGDLRTLSQEQLVKAKSTMQAIVAASLPHAQATITFEDGYPPLAPTDGNRKLLAMYDKASRDVGAGPVGPVDPDRAGAADVSFVAGEVKMILDGIGLMGTNDHTVKETADLATLPSQTKRAAVLLYRIAAAAGPR
jgi:glutamate carboxypeptidase